MNVIPIRNGGFEADWSEEQSHQCLICETNGQLQLTARGNIFTPPGWLVWFKHGMPVEHDSQNTVGWAQPEVRDAWITGDATRVHSGQKGLLFFTFFRIHDGGLMQQVQVQPGTRLRFSAWAHAWSNLGSGPNKDNPRWSEGSGVGFNHFFAQEGQITDSSARNFTFMVGIDPTGGTNPLADTVVWGKGAHIYNAYRPVPAVETTAQSSTVTIFLRSRCLWPFKHNDAYWDDAVLEGEPPEASGEWAYPLIARGSKLGIHGILSGPAVNYATTLANSGARFAVVKAVNDLGWLASIKAVSPQTITIARIAHSLEGCQGVNDPQANLDTLANGLMQPILNKLNEQPSLRNSVDYWEVPNEPDPPTVDGYRRLALLMIKCMERAEANNIKIGIFALNNGTPEWNEMQAIVETGVFARAKQGGHILTLHEGIVWADKPIDYLFGQTIPGSPQVEGAGALCFRYRYLYHLLQQRNEVIPLVISEWYCDRYQADGGTAAEVVERIRWYDQRARQDYWVLGFCPFTIGPVGGWTRQDYTFAYPSAVSYMLSIKDSPNASPSATPPVQVNIAFQPAEPTAGEQVQATVTANVTFDNVGLAVTAPNGQAVPVNRVPGAGWRWTFTPADAGTYHVAFTAGTQRPAEVDLVVQPRPAQPVWGLPREQYERTYVLLPPGAGREWVEAIVSTSKWQQSRWTIGGSADDAGIGALNIKTVIAINPALWGDDLRAFFQRYYPGTRYLTVEAATPQELKTRLENM